jgi:hypothetical protein
VCPIVPFDSAACPAGCLCEHSPPLRACLACLALLALPTPSDLVAAMLLVLSMLSGLSFQLCCSDIASQVLPPTLQGASPSCLELATTLGGSHSYCGSPGRLGHAHKPPFDWATCPAGFPSEHSLLLHAVLECLGPLKSPIAHAPHSPPAQASAPTSWAAMADASR